MVTPIQGNSIAWTNAPPSKPKEPERPVTVPDPNVKEKQD